MAEMILKLVHTYLFHTVKNVLYVLPKVHYPRVQGHSGELEKLLIDIGFVRMRGTFSGDKIFFKTYYHNNSAAVGITLIFDKEFKWKFLVCENNISPDIHRIN